MTKRSRDPEARVRQALVPAASRLTTADSDRSPSQILRLDASPVIIHVRSSPSLPQIPGLLNCPVTVRS